MTKTRIFWGALLLIIGGLLLAGTLGYLPMGTTWKIVWPAAIVLIGLWIILGETRKPHKPEEVESFSIPFENVKSARVEIEHGAGKFDIATTSNPDVLAEGTCAGGVEQNFSVQDGHASLRLHPKSAEFWDSSFHIQTRGLNWNISLSPKVPLELVLKTGADNLNADLSDLNVTNLFLETGASSSKLHLPVNIDSIQVKISAGAASIAVYIPPNLAGRIKMHSGISSRKIDTTRFVQKGTIMNHPILKVPLTKLRSPLRAV